jgi:hypothetical protein
MEAKYSSETSADFQWATGRYIPEDRTCEVKNGGLYTSIPWRGTEQIKHRIKFAFITVELDIKLRNYRICDILLAWNYCLCDCYPYSAPVKRRRRRIKKNSLTEISPDAGSANMMNELYETLREISSLYQNFLFKFSPRWLWHSGRGRHCPVWRDCWKGGGGEEGVRFACHWPYGSQHRSGIQESTSDAISLPEIFPLR